MSLREAITNILLLTAGIPRHSGNLYNPTNVTVNQMKYTTRQFFALVFNLHPAEPKRKDFLSCLWDFLNFRPPSVAGAMIMRQSKDTTPLHPVRI